jgi:hypothetical protein
MPVGESDVATVSRSRALSAEVFRILVPGSKHSRKQIRRNAQY